MLRALPPACISCYTGRMDWDKLRIFHAVAKAGSFTRAGNVLNLSQSAVSRQIQSLEDRLGVSLFHRHARGLLLTEQGEILFQAAADIFGRLSDIEDRLAETRETPSGPLTVTVPEFMGLSWFLRRLPDFLAAYPQIGLSVVLEDKVLNLGMREADCALRMIQPDQSDLVQRLMFEVPVRIYASSNYLERTKTPPSFENLADHRLICFPPGASLPFPGANWLYDGYPSEKKPGGPDARFVYINTLSGIFEASKAWLGLALLPASFQPEDHGLSRVLPDAAPPPAQMYFVYAAGRRDSKRIAVFRDYLLKTFRQSVNLSEL